MRRFRSYRLRPAAKLTMAACLSAGCYLLAPTGQYADDARPQWERKFGYFSAGIIAYADFFGEIDGVGPGTGVTFYMPPGAPVALALALPTLALGDFELTAFAVDGLLKKTPLGISGVSEPSRRYLSDFSVDLSFSYSRHEDLAYGGALDYTSLLIGIRLAGPRNRVPRYYLCGGVGLHGFRYDRRPDALVFGPYWGFGLENFVTETCALGLEYRMHFYFGDDEAGVPVDGGARQLAALLSWYW